MVLQLVYKDIAPQLYGFIFFYKAAMNITGTTAILAVPRKKKYIYICEQLNVRIVLVGSKDKAQQT